MVAGDVRDAVGVVVEVVGVVDGAVVGVVDGAVVGAVVGVNPWCWVMSAAVLTLGYK